MRVLACSIAFNESQKILRVIDRVDKADVAEFMVFDDGSTDGTAEAVRGRGFRVERHEHQAGVGAAIRDTIRIAQREKFDVVVIMAGNDKDRPREIPRLLAPIVAGHADFVQGSRYLPGGDFGNISGRHD